MKQLMAGKFVTIVLGDEEYSGIYANCLNYMKILVDRKTWKYHEVCMTLLEISHFSQCIVGKEYDEKNDYIILEEDDGSEPKSTVTAYPPEFCIGTLLGGIRALVEMYTDIWLQEEDNSIGKEKLPEVLRFVEIQISKINGMEEDIRKDFDYIKQFLLVIEKDLMDKVVQYNIPFNSQIVSSSFAKPIIPNQPLDLNLDIKGKSSLDQKPTRKPLKTSFGIKLNEPTGISASHFKLCIESLLSDLVKSEFIAKTDIKNLIHFFYAEECRKINWLKSQNTLVLFIKMLQGENQDDFKFISQKSIWPSIINSFLINGTQCPPHLRNQAIPPSNSEQRVSLENVMKNFLKMIKANSLTRL